MKDESFYRKWMGVCQQSKGKPLVLTHDNFTDEVVIRHKNEVLLRLKKHEFAELTANDIVGIIGDMK